MFCCREAILDTMDAHHKHAGIQGKLCEALANLAINTMAMEKIIRDLLIVTIILFKQTLMRIIIVDLYKIKIYFFVQENIFCSSGYLYTYLYTF